MTSNIQPTNLNHLKIENHNGPNEPLNSFRNVKSVDSAHVEVIFSDLEERLVRCIEASDVVFGCTAWLTSEPVLKALASRTHASVIVQKEDFLRPDSGNWSGQKLRQLYAKVPGFCRYDFGCVYDSFGNPFTEGVRCMGVCLPGKTNPRMHHKFFVFCRFKEEPPKFGVPEDRFIPFAVWTGSYNPTNNATRSIENAVIIQSSTIAEAYASEWTGLMGLSEPLDWQSQYVEPEYRIGT